MDKVIISPLKQIHHPKGDVLHALKKSDVGFSSFGEAYFSTVAYMEIKGWKRHNKMVMNLVVPTGKIEVVIYDEEKCEFLRIVLSRSNYKRLTIMPGLWVAFKGLAEENLLLNIASIEHDPSEANNLDLEEIKYDW